MSLNNLKCVTVSLVHCPVNVDCVECSPCALVNASLFRLLFFLNSILFLILPVLLIILRTNKFYTETSAVLNPLQKRNDNRKKRGWRI